MLRPLIFLKFFVGFCGICFALETPAASKTLGMFQGLEFGDYLYLNILDASGKKQSFYCNLPKCAEWERDQASFAKKKVLLGWAHEKIFFKEIDATKTVRVVRSLEIVSSP